MLGDLLAASSVLFSAVFSRLLEKCFEWFDKLTTNGIISVISMSPPFALNLSKGKWRFFQQAVRAR